MIDIQHSNERNFCGAITPKEKDKIMKAILDMAAHERKTFCFTPNDVPNLRINGKQFEMVIMNLSIRSIASQQVNDKNTSEAHHQPVQAICSTYLLSYINIKKSGKTVGNYRLKFI